MRQIGEVLNINKTGDEYQCLKCDNSFDEFWFFFESNLTGRNGIQCPQCDKKYFL